MRSIRMSLVFLAAPEDTLMQPVKVPEATAPAKTPAFFRNLRRAIILCCGHFDVAALGKQSSLRTSHPPQRLQKNQALANYYYHAKRDCRSAGSFHNLIRNASRGCSSACPPLPDAAGRETAIARTPAFKRISSPPIRGDERSRQQGQFC